MMNISCPHCGLRLNVAQPNGFFNPAPEDSFGEVLYEPKSYAEKHREAWLKSPSQSKVSTALNTKARPWLLKLFARWV